MIDYSITRHNLHIPDSYKVCRFKMRSILKEIREKNRKLPKNLQSLVFDRSLFSLKMEWIAHNALYLIGYQRERTKDVDLDNPCDRPEWQYKLAGIGVTIVEIAALALIIYGLIRIIR